MKNDVQNIFGDEIARKMENMVSFLEDMNLTPKHIAEYIEHLHELIRAGLHITALSNGNKELADKIDMANELIKLKRIDAFKQSVANGNHEEFLANMPWTDKSSLKIDMGLDERKTLTEEEQQYFNIIESSIDKDIENEALSQGFDSVEAWREYNSMKYSQNKYFGKR